MLKSIKTKFKDRKFRLKFISYLLIAATVVLFIYLVFLPFYPGWRYELVQKKSPAAEQAQDLDAVKQEVSQAQRGPSKSFPEADYSVSSNRVIIPKIGVNAPIVESESAEYGLARGAWRLPEGSTPPEGGNTVITGHRFKYLPPNNLTFYLFHKLETGDIVSVLWEEEEYYYRVSETKIVPKTQVSITDPTQEPRLTLFTCHPIYSQKERLVVIGEPMAQTTDNR